MFVLQGVAECGMSKQLWLTLLLPLLFCHTLKHCMNTVFTTFLPTRLYGISGKQYGTLYTYYDASVPLFNKEHISYAIYLWYFSSSI